MTLIEVVHFSITIFKEKTVFYTKKTDKTHHNVYLFNKKMYLCAINFRFM